MFFVLDHRHKAKMQVRLSALVIVDEPQGAYYGSVVAAPCAKEIFEGIISLKNIQPYQSE